MIKNTLSYCGKTVREHDPDRFLLSLMAPASAREALWALFAFNYEIARARETVSEPLLGRIRLQWWREALQRIYEDIAPPEHPIVTELAWAISLYNLPMVDFETLIAVREFDMEDKPHGDAQSFLDYADKTSTPLTKLCMRVIGGDPDHPSVKIVSVNYALAGLLRAAPFHESQGRRFMPVDACVHNIAAHFTREVRTPSRYLKAMQKLAGLYMQKIEKAGHNPALLEHILFKEIRVLISSIL
ncbi:MAG: phytoene/squalene synthase family protein [Alphaproteobacteria bacterium]